MEVCLNIEQGYWPKLVGVKFIGVLVYEKIKASFVPAWLISISPGEVNIRQPIYLSYGLRDSVFTMAGVMMGGTYDVDSLI